MTSRQVERTRGMRTDTCDSYCLRVLADVLAQAAATLSQTTGTTHELMLQEARSAAENPTVGFGRNDRNSNGMGSSRWLVTVAEAGRLASISRSLAYTLVAPGGEWHHFTLRLGSSRTLRVSTQGLKDWIQQREGKEKG